MPWSAPGWHFFCAGGNLHSHDPFTFCPKCAARLTPGLQLGEERLACPSCGWIHYEDPKVACAALLLNNERVLLVQRTMEPQVGAWSVPAGFLNARELPEDAVLHEVYEETGLKAKVIRLVDVLSGREHPRGSDILLVYYVEQVGGKLLAGDDAGDASWYPLDDLPPLAFESTHRILAGAVELQ